MAMISAWCVSRSISATAEEALGKIVSCSLKGDSPPEKSVATIVANDYEATSLNAS